MRAQSRKKLVGAERFVSGCFHRRTPDCRIDRHRLSAIRLRRIPDTLRFARRAIYVQQVECGRVHRDLRDRVPAVFCDVHGLWRDNTRHDAARIACRQFFRRRTDAAANALAQSRLHAFRRDIFYGIFVGLWDEDALTWHDRLSHTYLSPAPTLADIETTHVAHSR